MADESDEGKPVRIDLRVPPDLPSLYATNMVVQHTPHEFIVSFFNVQPPALLGTPEEKAQQLEAVDSVPAQCVARIVVAARRMGDFIQVLQDNHKTWERKVKAGAQDFAQ
jgi:hypothetical protein